MKNKNGEMGGWGKAGRKNKENERKRLTASQEDE
jgi:hypothetical protein